MSAPTQIVAIYLVGSILWIVGGDFLLYGLFGYSAEALRTAGQVKGLLFIGGTAVCLYPLIRGAVSNLEAARRQAKNYGERQAALASLSQAALAGNQVEPVLKEACNCIARLLRIPFVFLAQVDDLDPETLIVRESLVRDHRAPLGRRIPLGSEDGFLRTALRTSQPVFFRNPLEPRFEAARELFGGLAGSGLCVAIRGSTNVHGLIAAFDDRPREFPAEDREFVSALASIVGNCLARHVYRENLHRKSEELETIVEHIPVMLAVLDGNERPLRLNRDWERLLGWTLEESRAKGLLTLAIPEPAERERAWTAIRRAGVLWELFSLQTRENKTVQAALAAVQLSDGSRIVIAQDLTSYKLLEAQLVHAQKLEAVGRLAGGIAHDFNNILTTILGQVELALARLGDGPPDPVSLVKSLEQVKRAGQRAANLTRQLLTFSRRQGFRTETIHLNSLFQDMDKMLRRLLNEDVQLRLELGAGLPPVSVDPGQFEQVILNLVVNARDALLNSGVIEISTGVSDSNGSGPPREVVIQVRDNGIGIPAEHSSRIFEPFFTTKPKDKGTGLGLAVSRSIIEQCQGRIEVRSVVGEGSCFTIYLPRAAEDAVPAAEAVSTVTDVHDSDLRGEETILLCEDDDGVRRLTRSVLSSFGYRVLPARNGEEALAVIGRHRGTIDMLLSDVVMPGMSGRELADRIRVMLPETGVLLVSGYSEEFMARQGKLDPGVALLPKPYEPRDLLRRVRQVLDARGDGD